MDKKSPTSPSSTGIFTAVLRTSGSSAVNGSSSAETTTVVTETQRERISTISTPSLKSLDESSHFHNHSSDVEVLSHQFHNSNGAAGGPQNPFHDGSSANEVLRYREMEKLDMQRLNDLLSQYIEKVHFLNAQKQFEEEKASSTRREIITYDSTSFYAKHEAEFTKMKKSWEEDIERMRKQLEDRERKHSSDLQALKIEKSTLEDTLKRESLAHEEELHKIKNAFSERLISLESNYHTMQTSYEKQMINILAKGAREENKAYFSHAISEAIREIRTINDAILESKQQYLERFYQMKREELASQTKQHDSDIIRLKKEKEDWRKKYNDVQAALLKLKETSNFSHDDCQRSIDELKSELEARKVLIDQLDKDNVLLRSTKITLLEEIEVYRKLLDSLKIFSEIKTVESTGSSSEGEIHIKMRYFQNSMGNLVITPDQNAAFVKVENTKGTGLQDLNMDGWTIKQKLNNGKSVRFTFPKGFVLGANKSVKIWGENAGQTADSENLVARHAWLSGDLTETTLFDTSNKKIADCEIQSHKTVRGNFPAKYD